MRLKLNKLSEVPDPGFTAILTQVCVILAPCLHTVWTSFLAPLPVTSLKESQVVPVQSIQSCSMKTLSILVCLLWASEQLPWHTRSLHVFLYKPPR